MKYKDSASGNLLDAPYDHTYPVYLRHDKDIHDQDEITEQSEMLIDLEELPWV